MKKFLKNNIHTRDLAIQTLHMRNNHYVKILQEQASAFDIQQNRQSYIELKKIANDNPYNRDFTQIYNGYSESLHYGHLSALLEYGNINRKQCVYMPIIEHGVSFDFNIDNYSRGRIVAGPYKNHVIHKENPYIPTFCIGPYIHYATPFYSAEKYHSLKEKWGKTLLIVPQHTFEGINLEYDFQYFIDKIINQFGAGFDTIVACLYWNDFDSPIYDVLEKRSIPIISAGFRFDNNFIRRLKTIFELSDLVVSNYIGTHIAYALQLEKPFVFVSSELNEKTKNSNDSSLIRKEISNYFCKIKDVESQKLFVEPYFGFSHIKSSNEIHAIAELGYRILKQSKNKISDVQDSVQTLLKELPNMGEHEQFLFRLLQEAIELNEVEL